MYSQTPRPPSLSPPPSSSPATACSRKTPPPARAPTSPVQRPRWPTARSRPPLQTLGEGGRGGEESLGGETGGQGKQHREQEGGARARAASEQSGKFKGTGVVEIIWTEGRESRVRVPCPILKNPFSPSSLLPTPRPYSSHPLPPTSTSLPPHPPTHPRCRS